MLLHAHVRLHLLDVLSLKKTEKRPKEKKKFLRPIFLLFFIGNFKRVRGEVERGAVGSSGLLTTSRRITVPNTALINAAGKTKIAKREEHPST
jgi:hypothetical protein